MGPKYELAYRLPRTEVVISGTHTRISDDLLSSGNGESITQLDIAIQTIADLSSRPILAISQGLLSNYTGAITQNADGRLSSAKQTHAGQGPLLVKSLTTLTGALVRGALALGRADGSTDVTGDAVAVARRYARDYPIESAHRIDIAELQKKAHIQLVSLAKTLVEVPVEASSAKIRVVEIQSALRLLDSERQLVDLHFDAWRATTLKAVDNIFELRIAPRDLPATPEALRKLGMDAAVTKCAPATLGELWRRCKIGLIATWDKPRRSQASEVDNNATSLIQARRPDSLTLYQVQGSDPMTIIDVTHHLVVDEYSVLEPFDISKNFFSNTSLEVAFDADGLLVGLSTASSSAVSSAVAAAAGVASALAAGAESAGHAQKPGLETRRTTAAAELSRSRSDIDQRRERLLAVGLGATSENLDELRDLLHTSSILDAQNRVSGADPVLASEMTRHRPSRTSDGLELPPVEIRVGGTSSDPAHHPGGGNGPMPHQSAGKPAGGGSGPL